MMTELDMAIGPMDYVLAAAHFPVVPLIVGMVIAAGILLFTPSRATAPATTAPTTPAPDTGASAIPGTPASVAKRHRPELWVLAVTAAAIVIAAIAESIYRAVNLNLMDVVSWWRYALPISVAALGITTLLLVITLRGSAKPQRPTASPERRTWLSFVRRPALILTIIALTTLVLTTVLAGLASSPDDKGRFIYLEIPIPNESDADAIRPWFYGWAYGAPVLIAIAILLVVAYLTLRSNALRPYLQPQSVAGERVARGSVATGIALIAGGGMLVALGGAWRFISDAGTVTNITIAGVPYEAGWQYSEFAVAVGWLAPIAELIGFTLLFLVLAGSLAAARTLRAARPAATATTTLSVAR